MFHPEHIALHRELLEKAETKVAALNIDPRLLYSLLGGAGGAALGAIPAALITHHLDEKARKRTRNRSFGAGIATGLAAPRVLRGLVGLAQRAGLTTDARPRYADGNFSPDAYVGAGQ